MRHLRFRTMDDAVEELDRLENAKSVTTTGLWSYAQILDHIAGSLEFSISAYPRLAPAWIRKTVGRLIFRKMRRDGFMPSGRPNPGAPRSREEGDELAAMRRVRRAIAAFRAHNGPMAAHPFFDRLTREEAEHLQAMHMANHLSFTEPQEHSAKERAKSKPRAKTSSRKGSSPAKRSKKARSSKKR